MRYPLPVTMWTYPSVTISSHSPIPVYESNSDGWLNRSITTGTSNEDRILLFLNSTANNYGKLLRLSGGTTYPIFYADAEL